MVRELGGWRDGSAVKSTCGTHREPGFSSQHPHWGAPNRLKLQLQGIQHPLLASSGTHIHTLINKRNTSLKRNATVPRFSLHSSSVSNSKPTVGLGPGSHPNYAKDKWVGLLESTDPGADANGGSFVTPGSQSPLPPVIVSNVLWGDSTTHSLFSLLCHGELARPATFEAGAVPLSHSPHPAHF